MCKGSVDCRGVYVSVVVVGYVSRVKEMFR